MKTPIISLLFIALTAFQNCSPVDFGVAAVSSSSIQDPVCGDTDSCQTVQPFSCKTIQAVLPAANGVLEIPARSEAGLCFSVKLMDAIANSASNLTPNIDTDLISRDHDRGISSPENRRNPYLLGKSVLNFKLDGPRSVKLSGSGSQLSPILADNFILAGIYPQSIANPDPEYYRVYGTSDSSVGTGNGVYFRNVYLPINAFATGGTSTIHALDISSRVIPNSVYTLDVRALDCGAVRELSDIHLLFQ
jgi:hypothetical protein